MALIFTIPHKLQAYPTVGNWQFTKDGVIVIFVSELSDWRHEMLVAIHELVEATLCKNRGITEAQVDAFDMAYEKNRTNGDNSEPGDNPYAPYHKEHFFATNIERLMAGELGVGWSEYETRLNALP